MISVWLCCVGCLVVVVVVFEFVCIGCVVLVLGFRGLRSCCLDVFGGGLGRCRRLCFLRLMIIGCW